VKGQRQEIFANGIIFPSTLPAVIETTPRGANLAIRRTVLERDWPIAIWRIRAKDWQMEASAGTGFDVRKA
jgi:hypothetical protein